MPEEKLPEWFERDFFLHDKQQRSWDELEVGEEYETMPFTVTAERIAKYVEGTEDYNPVFCDQEAAKDSQFGGIIAPPTIVVPGLRDHPTRYVDKDAGGDQSGAEAGVRRPCEAGRHHPLQGEADRQVHQEGQEIRHGQVSDTEPKGRGGVRLDRRAHPAALNPGKEVAI